ncbi:MAG: hypothetical protein KC468_18630 [Myxococcales bacterium]|nr:hypothetical protein [Myxococcales bacterium]
MSQPLAIAIFVYLALILALSLWARARIHDAEDYIVAGRRLPLALTLPTVLATWFGAGTLLATTDEVRVTGLRVTALEPYGAALALVLVGLFYARPLWEARLLTVQDYFARSFGPRVERVAALYTIGYLGWIATQLVGLAGILEVFFAIPQPVGIVLVAAVATAYTLMGGMWSVTLTDALQMGLALVGLVWLGVEVLGALGGGVAAAERITRELPAEALVMIPRESAAELLTWIDLLLSGTVALIASQDLLQRVFAARSAAVARRACVSAGVLYALLGSVAVLIGLSSPLVLGDGVTSSILAHVAQRLLSPGPLVLFMLTVLSLVLSTLDSALLAPATVLAQNLLRPLLGARASVLTLTRLSVLGFGVASAALALAGERAFTLLSSSYALGVAPFLLLSFAMWRAPRREASGLALLLLGLTTWLIEQLVGWPGPIPSTVVVLLVGPPLYLALERRAPARDVAA